MSVVAVKIDKKNGKIYLGADSIAIFYATQIKDKSTKIFNNNGLYVGATGNCRDIELLRMFSKTRKPSRADEESILDFLVEFVEFGRNKMSDYKLESQFIFVFQGKVFNVLDLFVKEITDYMAIGAGMDYALTALYLGLPVEKAIEAACELSIYCEKPVNVLEIDIN